MTDTNYSRLASASVGIACQEYILGIPVGNEKASLATAIQKAGITKVLLVEQVTDWRVYTWSSCVKVYGN